MHKTQVWSLIRKDPTGRRATKPTHNYWVYAPELRKCNYWSPCVLKPMLRNKGRHPREKSMHSNQSVAPHSQKLERSPGISEHPAQQNTNKINKAFLKSHIKYIITLWNISLKGVAWGCLRKCLRIWQLAWFYCEDKVYTVTGCSIYQFVPSQL